MLLHPLFLCPHLHLHLHFHLHLLLHLHLLSPLKEEQHWQLPQVDPVPEDPSLSPLHLQLFQINIIFLFSSLLSLNPVLLPLLAVLEVHDEETGEVQGKAWQQL